MTSTTNFRLCSSPLKENLDLFPNPPFPMAPSHRYLLPVSVDSPILGRCGSWAGVGPRQLLPEALRCFWLEHSISPEASTCRQVRQSPREETASQVTLKFITLRGKGVLLIIMQGHKAYPGMYGYPLRMESALNLESKSLCPDPPPISAPVKKFLGLPGGSSV